jgi:di/tricarboxylate transporter
VTGLAYLHFAGFKLLPSNTGKLETITQNLKEYIVETEISEGSKLIGKTVKDAGLRNLSDLFLVEIARGEEIVSPVSPDEVLEKGDLLFFSGNTESIYDLIKSDNGIGLHKLPLVGGQFNFVEAVVPANSDLIGMKIKRSDFRNKYGASIVALHRDGKRVSGKLGETELSGGDFLLLVTGEHQTGLVSSRSLFFLSIPKVLNDAKPKWLSLLGMTAFVLLMAGIVNVIPLFYSCLIIISLFVFLRIIKLSDVRTELDLGLVMVLVCSLAVGVALEKSGAANLVAGWLISSGKSMGTVAALTALFIFTILLTSLITNAAAVSIVFPVAMSMAGQLHLSTTPFFVAIAFAASGSFMTPIGYQTNLMVYGPGGYSFKDFVRVGTPLIVLYTSLCILFISYFYHLV